MPRAELDSPLARVLASVTCPMICEPLGMITWPLDFTSCVARAVIWSPGLQDLESTGLESTALTVLSAARLAELVAAGALDSCCLAGLDSCFPAWSADLGESCFFSGMEASAWPEALTS